jgi:hypothetical protein
MRPLRILGAGLAAVAFLLSAMPGVAGRPELRTCLWIAAGVAAAPALLALLVGGRRPSSPPPVPVSPAPAGVPISAPAPRAELAAAPATRRPAGDPPSPRPRALPSR